MWPGTLSILRADLHIQLNPEKAGAATKRSIHVILLPLDITFSITLTEMTAVSIKSGVNCGLKPIWWGQGGKASFNDVFSLAVLLMLAAAQGEGLG